MWWGRPSASMGVPLTACLLIQERQISKPAHGVPRPQSPDPKVMAKSYGPNTISDPSLGDRMLLGYWRCPFFKTSNQAGHDACLWGMQPFFLDVSRKFMLCVQIETLSENNSASDTCLEHSKTPATPKITEVQACVGSGGW